MEQAAKGDRDAFGVLFERHQSRLVAFLTRFLGDRALAEDIAQEAYWNVWKKRETFDPRQSFRVFLYVVAKNLALNEKASAHRQRTVSLDALKEKGDFAAPVAKEPDKNPMEAALNNALECAVRRALAHLPADQRLCVLLHVYDQYSYPEIGRILGCSTVAARVLGFRGRNRLKSLLAPHLQQEIETDENA